MPRCYYNGFGVKKDWKEATGLLILAAQEASPGCNTEASPEGMAWRRMQRMQQGSVKGTVVSHAHDGVLL